MTTQADLSQSFLGGLRAIYAITNGSMNLDLLAGPRQGAARAEIMTMLNHGSKVPKSNAGITALRAKVLSWSGLTGPFTCEADLNEQVRKWMEKMLEPVA